MRQLRRAVVSSLVALVVVVAGGALSSQAQSQPTTPADLYQLTKIWNVHLTFTSEAWAGLTPKPQPPPTPNPGFIAREGFRNGISGARNGLDFQYVHANLEFEGRRMNDVAVRLKGNGTYTPGQKFGKPSLKIDLNKHVKGQKIATVSTINLHNNIYDPGNLNEPLAYRLYRDAGSPAPRTAYARVHVTVGGAAKRYLGLYSLAENVDTNFTADHFKVSGGAIFKPVTPAPFAFLGKDWAAYNQMYDPKTDLTAADQNRIIEFCEFLARASDAEYQKRAGDFIDIPSFAKFMAVVSWLANPDTILQQGQNYYVFLHPTTKKLHFVPWDQDHSWGQFVPWTPAEMQQQANIARPWIRPNRFLERTFQIEAFRKAYVAEMSTLARTIATPARISAQVDQLGLALRPAVKDEPTQVRVEYFEYALGEKPYLRPINFGAELVPIKTFVRAREASVLTQLKALGAQ